MRGEGAAGRGRLLLLSHEASGKLSLHHADSLKRLKGFAGQHAPGRGCAAVAPAAGLLLTAAREKTQLCYWRLGEREPFLRVSAAERLTALAVSADGNFSFAGTQSGQLLAHNVFSGELLGVLQVARGRELTGLALSADGRLLAVAGEGVRVVGVAALLTALGGGREATALGEAEVFRWARGSERLVTVEFLLLPPDVLVVAAADKTVSVVGGDGATLRTFALEEKPTCLCGTADGGLLVAGLESGRVALIRATGAESEVSYFAVCAAAVNSVRWNADRETAVVAGADRTLYALSRAGAVVAREALSDGSAVNVLSLPFEEAFLSSLAVRPREADDPPPPAKVVQPPPRDALLALTNPRPKAAASPAACADASTLLALFEREVLARSPPGAAEPSAPAPESAETAAQLRSANHRLLCKVIELEREGAPFKR